MAFFHSPLGLGVLVAAVTMANASLAFDKESATLVLSQVDLTMCRAPDAPRGEGHVKVTFTHDGNATSAVVDRGPMAGTPVAKCISGQFAKTKIPPFKGPPVHVGKLFRFE